MFRWILVSWLVLRWDYKNPVPLSCGWMTSVCECDAVELLETLTVCLWGFYFIGFFILLFFFIVFCFWLLDCWEFWFCFSLSFSFRLFIFTLCFNVTLFCSYNSNHWVVLMCCGICSLHGCSRLLRQTGPRGPPLMIPLSLGRSVCDTDGWLTWAPGPTWTTDVLHWRLTLKRERERENRGGVCLSARTSTAAAAAAAPDQGLN